MMLTRPSPTIISILMGAAALAAAPGAVAGVQVDLYEDFDQWQAAAQGDTTTIDFTGFPEGTLLTDQYQDQGVTFTTPFHLFWRSWSHFPNDGCGIDANYEEVRFTFDTPRRALAADFAARLAVFLYRDGEYVWHSSVAWHGQGPGNFGGLISSEPFDEVVLSSTSHPFLDDLHFGVPVPAPAALPLLALGLGTARRRRRGGE